MNKISSISIASIGLAFSALSQAGSVVVPYFGSFDEATVATEDGLPAGDYDTIGGVDDVALFNLIEGTNSFTGSIWTGEGGDPSDVFNIGIGSGLVLTSASIDWGTNLPGIVWYPYGPFGVYPPAEYRQQSDYSTNSDSPDWFFEESSITPEIFTINELANPIDFGESGMTFESGPLNVTEGIYLSSLIGVATCAQTYDIGNDGFYYAYCVEGIDYTMTFTVESDGSSPPVSAVPLPGAVWLFGTAIAGFAGFSRYKKKTA